MLRCAHNKKKPVWGGGWWSGAEYKERWQRWSINMRIFKTHPILGLVNSYIGDSPQPANISYMWNFGSLLGCCLIIQIITGVTLAMHYTPSVDLAFISVEHIIRDVEYGWLIRYLHANVASFFFIFVYLHIGRGLYYGSYKSPRTLVWAIGVIILIVIIATAFMGYVLPYGQMSLWGSKSYRLTCSDLLSILITSYYFIMVYQTSDRVSNRVRANIRIGPHHHDIMSIFYGVLLGESHVERRWGGIGVRLSMSQESHRSGYLLWLHAQIANRGYCNSVPPKIQTRLCTGGKLRYIFRFHTFTYSSLRSLYSAWYKDNIKHIPNNMAEFITPLALAIWVIDDGARVGKGIKLCTNSFTYKDCTRLTQVIHDLYNVKSSVQSAGRPGQYHIYIWAESISDLRSVVRPHIVSSILYKLGEK